MAGAAVILLRRPHRRPALLLALLLFVVAVPAETSSWQFPTAGGEIVVLLHKVNPASSPCRLLASIAVPDKHETRIVLFVRHG